jgi:hypothetical protein
LTFFTATTAAALEAANNKLNLGLYSYHTDIQLDLKAVGNRAPAVLRSILQQLVADETTIAFYDNQNYRINVDEFPADKAAFDGTFCTETARNQLSFRFEIRSSRKFVHAIKVGVWDILKK